MTQKIQPTAEEIARHYDGAMSSVGLISAGRPKGMSDEEWAGAVARNKAHLQIMIAKDFWTTEDLTPLQAACLAALEAK